MGYTRPLPCSCLIPLQIPTAAHDAIALHQRILLVKHMCDTHRWAVQVRSQDDLGKVGLVDDSLKERLRVADARLPLQEVWVSGIPIAPAAAAANYCGQKLLKRKREDAGCTGQEQCSARRTALWQDVLTRSVHSNVMYLQGSPCGPKPALASPCRNQLNTGRRSREYRLTVHDQDARPL